MKAQILLWGGGKRRSWKREALMVAGTAGIGTAVGGLAGGKKGATLGAISGGMARLVMRMAEVLPVCHIKVPVRQVRFSDPGIPCYDCRLPD
jgi:hypothetical protein